MEEGRGVWYVQIGGPEGFQGLVWVDIKFVNMRSPFMIVGMMGGVVWRSAIAASRSLRCLELEG